MRIKDYILETIIVVRLTIVTLIIIIIITNFYTGLKNPSVCNTVVLGVLELGILIQTPV